LNLLLEVAMSKSVVYQKQQPEKAFSSKIEKSTINNSLHDSFSLILVYRIFPFQTLLLFQYMSNKKQA